MKSVNYNKYGKEISHTSSMFRHLNTAHNISEHSCTKCGVRFKRKDYFLRHVRREHPMTHVVTTDTENINPAKTARTPFKIQKAYKKPIKVEVVLLPMRLAPAL